MTFIQFISDRFLNLGLPNTINEDIIEINDSGKKKIIKFDSYWQEEYEKYLALRTKQFDATTRILQVNTKVEIQLTQLYHYFGLNTDEYEFIDDLNNSVKIGRCSQFFRIAYIESTEFDKVFDSRIKNRILLSSLSNRNVNTLFPSFVTATYIHKGRKIPSDIQQEAIKALNSCLFKLSVDFSESLSIYKAKKKRINQNNKNVVPDGVLNIPKANYEENVVSYYKVAKSSPFPSQSFLSYYHVIEYYFLKVSELNINTKLAGYINSPSFQTSSEKLEKVVSIVRSHDLKNDETEMLRNVLERYVIEEDLIKMINDIEKECGEKIYTKSKKIFGEYLQINPIKDHALNSIAKVLKHIRNAIVHSSDRYSRDECHIPLTDSEDLIEDYIPIIKYLAENVIYGNAK